MVLGTRMTDPDFGDLLFFGGPNAYWECEWKFPKTGTVISINLPGDESGPSQEARQFYLALPARYETILAAVRTELEKVFRHWFEQELPQDIFTVVKLSGFGVWDAKTQPLDWDISFETTGDKWLGIRIPFIGDTAQEAVVDT